MDKGGCKMGMQGGWLSNHILGQIAPCLALNKGPWHTYIHTYITFNQFKKGCIPIIVNNTQMKAIPSCDTYQVRLRWCQIVGFLTSFCASMFLWMFHSIGAHRSPHLPSKMSWTCAYATLMDFLFELPWSSLLTHTKTKPIWINNMKKTYNTFLRVLVVWGMALS
jgi:hypothetical protein